MSVVATLPRQAQLLWRPGIPRQGSKLTAPLDGNGSPRDYHSKTRIFVLAVAKAFQAAPPPPDVPLAVTVGGVKHVNVVMGRPLLFAGVPAPAGSANTLPVPGLQIWIERLDGFAPTICVEVVTPVVTVANGKARVGCAFDAVIGNHQASARATKTAIAKRPDAKR